MISETRIDLIHRDLEGETTPEESVTLKALLAERPEDARLYEDLRRVFSKLREIEMVDPPPHLRASILERVHERSAPAARRPSLLRSFFDSFRIRHAYVFVAGAALGMAALAPFTGTDLETGVDRSLLTGTLLETPARSAFETISRERLALGEVQGSVRTARGDGVALVEIAIHGVGEAEIRLQFEAGAWRFRGFERVDTARGDVEVGPGRVSVFSAREGTYRVLLDDTGASTGQPSLQVRSGVSSWERKLDVGHGRSDSHQP